jgi:hypothetical protein
MTFEQEVTEKSADLAAARHAVGSHRGNQSFRPTKQFTQEATEVTERLSRLAATGHGIRLSVGRTSSFQSTGQMSKRQVR